MEVGPELQADAKLAKSMSKDKLKGLEGVMKKIRYVFNLDPLGQDNGLEDLACLELLDHFLDWAGVVKKNSKNTPMSAMATPDVTKPSPDVPLPTSNILESGSTAGASSTAAPAPSSTPSTPDLGSSNQAMNSGTPTATALEKPS
jgi:hypothetical protein